ncbi:MAG: pyridoxamine 5'-phosphate oxidase family protein [Lachnospiraceae bacterium]
MTKNDYLKYLVETIHSATVATIGADGHPQTRVIDMMLWDEQGVYFLTARGKAFYEQLMEQGYVALSATRDNVSISLRGKIKISAAKSWTRYLRRTLYAGNLSRRYP